MSHVEEQSSELDEASRRVYSAPPDDFVQVRSDLVAGARDAGDRELAKAIGALRKPTSAAAIVNRQALDDPSVTGRLVDMGSRLRAAQGSADGIDRDVMRNLSLERRALVQDLSTQAIETFGPSSGAAIRDEVVATLDAAVADPDVAARFGRLTHAEQWSGFGAVADAPVLTVVPGETRRAPVPASRPRTRPRSQLADTEKKLSAARNDLREADEQVESTRARVDELARQLDEMQRQLAAARREATTAVTAQRSARSRHREAQSARDRAARRPEV